LWTTGPDMIMETPKVVKNDAIQYITNRPFEPVPILVEYISLYLLSNKILSQQTLFTILCMGIISVIIAISDVKGNGNTIFPLTRNQSAAPQPFPEIIYQGD